jgi:hypothetical protein
LVQQGYLVGNDVQADDLVVLGKKDSIRQTNVTGTGDCDLHLPALLWQFASLCLIIAVDTSVFTLSGSQTSIQSLNNRLIRTINWALSFGTSR